MINLVNDELRNKLISLENCIIKNEKLKMNMLN